MGGNQREGWMNEGVDPDCQDEDKGADLRNPARSWIRVSRWNDDVAMSPECPYLARGS
jgi:hypothetical protein